MEPVKNELRDQHLFHKYHTFNYLVLEN